MLWLVLLAACVVASLTTTFSIEHWIKTNPKTSNHFTLLAGDCGKTHLNFLHQRLPPNRFRRVGIRGPQDLFAKTVKALQDNCLDGICPSLVLFYTHIDTPSASMGLEEIYRAFYAQSICKTPEYGGLKVDCTRVWFAISSCMGKSIAGEMENTDGGLLQVLESPIPISPAEVQREVRFELKSLFGSSNQFTTQIPLVVVPAPPPPNDHTDKSADVQLRRLIDDLLQNQQRNAEKPTAASNKKPVHKVDFSFLSESHFLGQEWARNAAINALDAVDKNIKQTRGPIVFFLLGGAGTGKTLLAKLIAQAYHGGKKTLHELQQERKFTMFAMADYKSESDVDSFTSPRQGLVGRGSLIEIFEATPAPIIVFDEIEKAHPSLLNEMMLAMLDDNNGFVQDKKDSSKKYSTANAIFILTSNCFADVIAEKFTGSDSERQVSREVLAAMDRVNPAQSRCAAFAKTEVARRMKAGHAFSNLQEFGFVVFVPPPIGVVESMVRFFLLDYQAQYRDGRFAWTKRAEQVLKRLAKQRYLETAGTKHGGLSEVQSYLTGVLIQAMREAMQDCQGAKNRDVLLYAKMQQEIKAVVVGCNSSINSGGDLPGGWEHPVSTTSSLNPVSHNNVEGEEEDVEQEIDEETNYWWNWQCALAFMFAVSLSVALLLQPLLLLQLATALFTLISTSAVLLPQMAGTGLLTAMLWPWLGWKSLLVAPLINAVLYWLLFPMSWLYSRIFSTTPTATDTKLINNSNPVYVSFATRPREKHKFRRDMFVELERRIRFRGEFTTTEQVKQEISSSSVLVVCIGDRAHFDDEDNNGQGFLANLDAWNILEMLLASTKQAKVHVMLHSSYLHNFRASLDRIDALLEPSAWKHIARETKLENPQQELFTVLSQWNANTFIVCDEPQLARLQLFLIVKQAADVYV